MKVFFVDFKSKKLIKKEIVKNLNPENDSKLEAFSKLIINDLVRVFINTKTSGLQIPKSFYSNQDLTLDWSLKFNLKDFKYNEYGISGTLSFDKKQSYVFLPWDSIWSMSTPNNSKNEQQFWRNHTSSNFLENLNEFDF